VGYLHVAPLLFQDSLVELGIIHLSLNEYDEALKVFSEALHMREEESREISNITESKEAKLKEAKVLNNIGCVHFEREDSEEALHAFDSAVKLQRSALQTESRNFSASSQPASKPSYLTMACTLCNKGMQRHCAFVTMSLGWLGVVTDTHPSASLLSQDMQSLN
jgi:tetratricopeptide (TPR) repeat protein